MRPHQPVKVMAEAGLLRTPPSLKSGLAWRAGASYTVSEALGKGPGVPSSSDTSGISKSPQGRQLGPTPPSLEC